jgi:hypothetical protein
MKKTKKKKSTKKATPTKKAASKKPAPKKAAPKKPAPKKPASKKPAPKKPAGFARAFPAVLRELHALPFEYDGGEGIDFEPYDEFMSPEDNTSWIRAWTGNQDLTGHEYRVFGQDGTGGYAAFWLVRPGADLLEQPIVFFGSEGELGVVAKDFNDYLWVLAHGAGPLEAVSYGGETSKPNDAFAKFATQHAPKAKKTAKLAIAAAKKEFPRFEEQIRSLVKY